jgi:hypothetical protein
MPRRSRIDALGAVDHIITRGIELKAIFRDDRDRADFLERLGSNLEDLQTVLERIQKYRQQRPCLSLANVKSS